MRAEDVMTREVYVAQPDTPLKDVAAFLLRRGIRGMPVVTERRQVVGMITEADLIAARAVPDPRRHARRDAPAGPRPRTAGEAMTTPVVSARPDADLSDLARLMLSEHLTRVPILDDHDRLVGLVSRRDLLRLLTRPDSDIAEDVRRVVADWYAGPAPTVTVTDGEVTVSNGDGPIPTLLTALIQAVPGAVAVRQAGRPEPEAARP
jgi:CBS domain-containing protein